jgi:hypothetical protein
VNIVLTSFTFLVTLLLWLFPVVHVVLSKQWSTRAKVGWAIAVVALNVVGYAVFLVVTLRRAVRQLRSIPEPSLDVVTAIHRSTLVVTLGRICAVVGIGVLIVWAIRGTSNEQVAVPWILIMIFVCWILIEMFGHLVLFLGCRQQGDFGAGTTAS